MKIGNLRRDVSRALLAKRGESGFSMIEVLVALLVLAFGLLGFALLQTMNLRFTQSANYRTEATNLAYDLIDQMRANRHQAGAYATAASFTAGSVTDTLCTRPVGAGATVANNALRWQCQVANALGPSASAAVTHAINGEVTVDIRWGDHRWQDPPPPETSFLVATRL